MDKDKPIEISQVDNGFIVRGGLDERFGQAAASKVFQSFAELHDFLEGHFTHRNKDITSDE